MKRLLLIVLSFLALADIGAAERSQKQLLRMAGEVLNAKLNMVDATRGGESLRMLYDDDQISVAGYRQGGFVVLAKEDVFSPVLGYSVSAFNTEDNNPGFKMWMQATYRALTARAAIAPVKPEGIPSEVASFVASKWNQESPYNLLCPTFEKKGTTKHYPTGCVATAMAQAMYYYKYPEKGEGKHTYRFDPGTGAEETVSVLLDTIPLDWKNMIDSYKTEYTAAQAKAVAELMKICGSSVDMQYTETGSGAMMPPVVSALRTNFGYDAGLALHFLDYESSAEYYSALYKAIGAKIPVVYAGASDQGGHCFVLDGYDEDGLFSVNWGWGGTDDGMFNILSLNGYAEQQQYIPVTNQGVYKDYASKFGIEQSSVDFAQIDGTHFKVSTTGRPLNMDGDAYQGNFYVVACNLATGEGKAVATFELKTAIPAYYYVSSENGLSKPYITIANKLEDGDYRLFLASKTDAEKAFSPFRTNDDQPNSALMTIKDGVITSFAVDASASWMTSSKTVTGISPVVVAPAVLSSSKTYNLNGQQVDGSYRGVVIKNGKKYNQ